MAYSDASWAKAQGSARQHGCLLFVALANVSEALVLERFMTGSRDA